MKIRSFSPLLVLALAASFQCASAADKFWNPLPLTGTWDTATTNWATASAGIPDQLWVDLDNAFFDQAGTYAVTVSGARTVGSFNLSAGSVTFTGSEISATTLVAGGTGISKISNILSGTSTITKSGTGSLELAGINTFTGGTTPVVFLE